MNIDLLIDGAPMAAASGRVFERRDPVTGEVATRAAAAGPEDIERAVASAARAFESWSQTGPGQRRAILLRAADLVDEAKNRFMELMTAETGATAPWAGFNVHLAANMLREAAALTTQITGEVIPSDKSGILSMGIRQPVGVLLAMAPWNAPVILGTRAIAAPLACGNAVILRSSEMCPGTHGLIGELVNRAGLPPGVLNVLSNAPEDGPTVVEALVSHKLVRRINFTGSSKVGKIIAKLAAEQLKPVLLELGGKAPFLVLDDADLEHAVEAAAFGAFMNQGQICMSTERFVVDNSVADTFVARLAAKASSLSAGNPRDHVVLGSLISVAAAERMDALIADAVAKGGTVVAGGGRTGSIVEATVIDHVTPEMRIYSEESFGPVKPVVRVAGVDEAVRVANDTEYGLSAAIFSRDVTRALAVSRRLQTGICHINGPTLNDEPHIPFGGMKDSGYGRFGGRSSIAEFTELRWITVEGQQSYPF